MMNDCRTLSQNARIAVLAARDLQDEKSCFVGIGIPSDAACLAKLSHAPNLSMIYESGVIGTLPYSPAMSTGSPSIAYNSDMITDSFTVFGELQAGRIDIGLLSAAQVDAFGNLNSTVIGPYENPKIRMVGSGGAHDIACLVPELIILMPHDSRRFVNDVDFITSPGANKEFAETRLKNKLGSGPVSLITDRARFYMSKDGWKLDAPLAGYSYDEATEDLPWDVGKGINNSITISDDLFNAIRYLPYLEAKN
ncbi:CoA-transferase subunit beta [Hyphomicrobiales bacterium]|jgi:glutaconate CoA-transferase, subunit B|nr:CoA-transferase subunit beta [Rhodobiaceae bacterium]MBT5640979.1 CoA-transferase subunit beta [Rhodobiaceae bacterium]MBT6223658.1 CoA-transferase subunit beta [Rhodobiaceae bacterium]MDB4127902.1 CoA-transferase subunit beta [Hyphomicrobiales bacterium]MDB4831569.1 CoA-transferase subunit beta [Hyphomicrobiales bacterium]|tara:strand:+ start:584 stop:1339 length:756 start_codon:yes stop_codon:yes gene_type:complete